jgi:hypothetical protein
MNHKDLVLFPSLMSRACFAAGGEEEEEGVEEEPVDGLLRLQLRAC